MMESATTQSQVLTLSVQGMTCGACAARIERKLNKIDGVQASVSLASEQARVTLDAKSDPEILLDCVADLGYSARVVTPEQGRSDQLDDLDRRVKSLGKRLIVAGLIMMPLGDCSLVFWLEPTLRFPGWQLLLCLLALPVVTWCAWPFYQAAARGVRHFSATMDTLVSLGIIASTLWSLYAMFWLDRNGGQGATTSLRHLPGGAIYLDVAGGVVTFLLAGRWFEAVARRRSGGSLRALAALNAKTVTVMTLGGEMELPIAMLAVGDKFVVRPGTRIATDGIVVEGASSIDMSAMTGESVPVEVVTGDGVLGGTIATNGRLIIEATKVGRDTQLARMIDLVEEAQSQKAAAQRLADRIAGVFVPIVIGLSIATFSAWKISGSDIQTAVNNALSVLIIACPCALGLATPMALMVASGRGASLGIYFKDLEALERSRYIDTLVIDKTGTLTTGHMAVSELYVDPLLDRSAIIRQLGALETASRHAVARAIASWAEGEVGELPTVVDFMDRPGHGVQGTVDGVLVEALSLQSAGELPAAMAREAQSFEALGMTMVVVRSNAKVAAIVGLSDHAREEAQQAIRQLHDLNLRCTILSGDTQRAAEAIGRQVEADEVIANALPSDKVDIVRTLQAQNNIVAMVGDGINDGPALATADLGIAVGNGTDVALGAASVIIMRSDLRVLPIAIYLSRKTAKTIRGNLIWAFGYNVAAIPLAMAGLLNPLIAAAAMALSSGFVVYNSSRIRYVGEAKNPT
jgi:P-type Cu+ transporter